LLVGSLLEQQTTAKHEKTLVEVLGAAAKVGSNTVITIDANNTITPNDILKTALVANDFVFV
jgi:hypothetical protein